LRFCKGTNNKEILIKPERRKVWLIKTNALKKVKQEVG